MVLIRKSDFLEFPILPSQLAIFRSLPSCKMVQIVVLLRRSDFLEVPIMPSELAIFRSLPTCKMVHIVVLIRRSVSFGGPYNALRTGYFL